MSDQIVIKDGNICGPFLPAQNLAANMTNTIHTDELGKKAGMRGGVVVGTHHLDLFPPLLFEAFGPEWAKHGTISMFYTYAMLAGEERRAVIEAPPKDATDAQVKVWVETPDGKTICTGTASIGNPNEPSYVMALNPENADRKDIRILHDMHPGDDMGTADVILSPDEVDTFGGIVAPGKLYHLMRVGAGPEDKYISEGKEISFYGATEIRIVDGPLRANIPYLNGGTIACVGATKKTEFLWFDTYLEEKETGRRVAECRQMTRFMKQGSAAYGNA